MSKWRRFWRLPRREGWLLARALVLLPLVRVALRPGRFRGLRAILARPAVEEAAAAGQVSPAALLLAQQAARMVAAASREGLCHGNCLEQSIVLLWLLHWRKIPARLRIGVRKQAAELEAHAWVELGNMVLNDGADVHQRYEPLEGDLAPVRAEYR